MLIRLRSSTLGILGVVAAVGLGLVAIVYQQSWPDGLTGPLPQAPGPDFLRNDSIAAPPGPAGSSIVAGQGGSAREGATRTRPGGPHASATSELTAAQQVSASPQPAPVPDQPTASPQPAGKPASPATPASTPQSAGQTSEGGGRPGTSEDASPPVAADGGEQSPGQSGEEHGHHGSGPPSWAGHDEDSSGHGSWDDGYGDDGYGGYDDGDHGHGYDDHGGGWGRH